MALEVSRDDVVLAVAGGLWAAAFLPRDASALLVIVPLTTLALLMLRRFPIGCALVFTALTVLLTHLDTAVQVDRQAGLLPAIFVAYAVGRRAHPTWGLLALLLLPLVIVWADHGVSRPDALTLVLFAGAWGFGRAVRHRALAALAVHEEAALLAATDPAQMTAVVLREERERLAVEALAVIRIAVRSMSHDARRASADLDPHLIRAILDSGSEAVSELRRLLGLLRSDSESTAPAPTPAEQQVPDARRGLGRPGRAALVVLIVTVLLVGLVIELGVLPDTQPRVGTLGLTIALTLTLLMRGRYASLGTWAATAVVMVALVTNVPLGHGLVLVAVLMLTVWSGGEAAGSVGHGARARAARPHRARGRGAGRGERARAGQPRGGC